MDYQAYPVLYVDDEVTNLQGMRYLLDDRFTLLTTADPGEALRILDAENIAVLLTDELTALHDKLAGSLEHVGDLIQAGLSVAEGPSRFAELLIAAKRTHGAALGDLERLAGLTRRLRDGSTIKSALAARCDVVRAVD